MGRHAVAIMGRDVKVLRASNFEAAETQGRSVEENPKNLLLRPPTSSASPN